MTSRSSSDVFPPPWASNMPPKGNPEDHLNWLGFIIHRVSKRIEKNFKKTWLSWSDPHQLILQVTHILTLHLAFYLIYVFILFVYTFWHCMCHSIWHSVWHFIWYIILLFTEMDVEAKKNPSVHFLNFQRPCQRTGEHILSGIQSDMMYILTFYLEFFVAFYLTSGAHRWGPAALTSGTRGWCPHRSFYSHKVFFHRRFYTEAFTHRRFFHTAAKSFRNQHRYF